MNTPVFDFVKKYGDSDTLRLHMPGHKGRGDLGVESLDITEISGADVLYGAEGIIKQSEENAAALFGTKRTFYSAEGSSLAIRGMLYLIKLYALSKNTRPIVFASRNAHKTFVNACALLDIEPEWMMPDDATLISCNITAEYLDARLSQAKEKPTAVYVTSPDYLGNILNIGELSRVCKKHGVMLAVDNAHGAYLKFLPEDIHPITLGADICCDSAHKTLPVLTGGAYLHIGKNAAELFCERGESAFSLFATTSPSYLILASLDRANLYLADGYRQKLAMFTALLKELKAKIKVLGFTLLGDEPLKLTVAPKSFGYTGYELAEIFEKQNIMCEFADLDYIVFMFTPETGKEGLLRLQQAFYEIEKKCAITALPPKPTAKIKKIAPSRAIYKGIKEIPVEQSIGKICADLSVSCPPAIPIVICGEEIDETAVESFKYYGVTKVKVIDEESQLDYSSCCSLE